MTGPDLDPQLTASMRRMIIRHARTNTHKKISVRRMTGALATAALVVGVATAAVAVVIAGVPQFDTPPPAATAPAETPAPSPTTTPTPTPMPTPTNDVPNETTAPPAEEEPPTADLVAGYDARVLWDLCVSRGQEEFPGAVTTSEYELRFVHLTPDGIPEVYVSFDTPDEPMPTGTIWICQFGGDPAAPTLDFFNTKDI